MQVSDFDFELPDELIARYPQPQRTASRLLQLNGNSGELNDGKFTDVLDLVQPGDLIVLIILVLFLHACLDAKNQAVKLKY